jgi:hypothetical protein
MLCCITNVNTWMSVNRLKLNPAKTEFMWCSTPKMVHHVDHTTPFVIENASIVPVKSVKLLGVYIDHELSMTTQVNRTVSTCFYQLRRLKAARRSLPIEAAKTGFFICNFTRGILQQTPGWDHSTTSRQAAVNSQCCSSSLVRWDQEGSYHAPNPR